LFKKILWYSIITIAVAGIITLSVGFYQAMKYTGNDKADVTAEQKSISAVPSNSSHDPNSINLTIMGDSIAKGTGDEKGEGFSFYLPDALKNLTPKDIKTPVNVGIDGLKSAGLLEQLQSGTQDQLIADSDFIVISIGGNDLLTLLSVDDSKKEDNFKPLQDTYLSNLKEIIKIIRNNNKTACIIVLGLYNPNPDTSTYIYSSLINTWNYNTQQFIEEDNRAVFIPTFDLFRYNLNKYLAKDGLHPNSNGYREISNRIAKSVEGILSNG
jgi:lysophospholipase L1-like esterase